MREYELVFITQPDLDDKALDEVVQRVKSWIIDDGGEISRTDLWGKKRLAYSIRKQNEGQYIFMRLKMQPNMGVKLERNLRLQELILRFLLTFRQ